MINNDELNAVQLNAFDLSQRPCTGVTLADLRQRLRNELSNYAPGTLIPDDPTNDIERQFINDGISCLWPHDYEVVMQSTLTTYSPHSNNNYYILPQETEHVFSVFDADIDVNNNEARLDALPHRDMWLFDKSFVAATTRMLTSGEPWINDYKKVVRIRGRTYGKYIVCRYARKWKPMVDDGDCIDPSPTRLNAIIFYACYQYFVSQMQVNTESIRYRNYQQIATQFQAYYQQHLTRDSKPLYIL